MKHEFHSELSPEEIMGRIWNKTEPGTYRLAMRGPTVYHATVLGRRRFYLAVSPCPGRGWGRMGYRPWNASVFRGRLLTQKDNTTLIRGSFGLPIWVSIIWFGLPLVVGTGFFSLALEARLPLLMFLPMGLIAAVVLAMFSMGAYAFGHIYGGEWEERVLRFIHMELIER